MACALFGSISMISILQRQKSNQSAFLMVISILIAWVYQLQRFESKIRPDTIRDCHKKLFQISSSVVFDNDIYLEPWECDKRACYFDSLCLARFYHTTRCVHHC